MYSVSDVHPQQRPLEHGSGPVLSWPDDPAAGDGPGSRGRGRGRLHPSVQCRRNRQDEGEDPEALRHRAQQAPGPTEHNGTENKDVGLTLLFSSVWIISTLDYFPRTRCRGGKALKRHWDDYTSPPKPLTNNILLAALQSGWVTATHMCQDILSSSIGAEDLFWSKMSTVYIRFWCQSLTIKSRHFISASRNLKSIGESIKSTGNSL